MLITGQVRVPYLLHSAGGQEPTYGHAGDAGADLYAREGVTLAPGERALVPTGVYLALPEGTVGLVHPRSGLAAKHGVTVLNAPGTIDSGYRGEVLVNLINLDPAHTVTLAPGDRIAQLVVQAVLQATFERVDSLPEAERGDNGHGSTGGLSTAPSETPHQATSDDHRGPTS